MPWSKWKLTQSLSSRLILGFVAAIIVTTIAAGVPAYWMISRELEQEAQARLQDGVLITDVLLEAEKTRLVNLASLTSQRPTLRNLLRERNTSALVEYIQDYQTSVDLDLLILCDNQGLSILGDDQVCPWGESPTSPRSAFHLLPLPAEIPAFLAGLEIRDENTAEVLGYVTVGNYYDDTFATQLSSQTGFHQSLILGGKRFVTTIEGSPESLDSETIQSASDSGSIEVTELTLGGERFLTALLPLEGWFGEVIALAEVGLSVNSVVAAQHRALLTLNVSTLGIIAVVSLLSLLFAQRLTSPLSELTEAAHKISQGDYSTPIRGPDDPIEIATLARALEESRASTHRYLRDLSQEKAWSETLIESIKEGIVTVNAQGLITSFSQGAERITGWERAEALHATIDEILPLAELNGSFVDHIPVSGIKQQINVLTKQERPISLAVTATRIATPKGEEEQVLVLQDVTQEEALQNLRSYFLANISHEFRTPLSALNASVELLLEDLEDLSQAEIGNLLNSIHMSVSGLQTLIDNLLESLSIEAGRFRIRRRRTDFNEILLEAVRVMKPLLERRQQTLSLDQPERLLRINADPTRLTQVLVNLLSNASKYGPLGKPIDVSLEEIDAYQLKVSVADRGPGIPTDERENLFSRFIRLDTQDNTQYGIGLGLSVVKAIVEEHSGKVGVEERPGGGSIFWFTLPLDSEGS
ncbi:MAG TPA: HAMP domain-containing protein [Anaerolineae bacterium]|nr:HAMP domain-containing protein [Anaerolineae bacterium]